jgi:hypothetical protein
MKLTGNLFMTSSPSALAGNLPSKATRSRVASVGIRRARVPLSRHVEGGLEVIPFSI